eukprot:g82012.t1
MFKIGTPYQKGSEDRKHLCIAGTHWDPASQRRIRLQRRAWHTVAEGRYQDALWTWGDCRKTLLPRAQARDKEGSSKERHMRVGVILLQDTTRQERTRDNAKSGTGEENKNREAKAGKKQLANETA